MPLWAEIEAAPGKGRRSIARLFSFCVSLRLPAWHPHFCDPLPQGDQEDARNSARWQRIPELARVPGAPRRGGEFCGNVRTNREVLLDCLRRQRHDLWECTPWVVSCLFRFADMRGLNGQNLR